MCVDYRKLNAKTINDAYPLPRIEESFDALQGASWFSTLDLASGFNQIGVTEEDKAKTAFITPLVCLSTTGCLLDSVTHLRVFLGLCKLT